MFIESLQNSHVKDWCKLKQKKYRDVSKMVSNEKAIALLIMVPKFPGS